jgi:polysaccharide export outer membrane protein
MNRLSNSVSDLLKLGVVLFVLGAQVVIGQSDSLTRVSEHNYAGPEDRQTPNSPQLGGANSSGLLIGSGDEVEVAIYDAPDLSVHGRVGADGTISMPLIGYVPIAGLTSSQAEASIEDRLLREKVLNNPQVSVYVKEYTGSGISVTGEVAKPGVYSALGPHRLFDILQDAGGLTDRASDAVIISHRDSEHPRTVELPKDADGLSRLNVDVLPGDTVIVPKAGIVYVLGAVNKPGGYVLNSEARTVLRVLAAAGGPSQGAAVGGTKMLRRTPAGLQELPVPLKKLLHAKAMDIPVQADDIVFVPNSRIKQVLNAGALATTASTAAIYRLP